MSWEATAWARKQLAAQDAGALNPTDRLLLLLLGDTANLDHESWMRINRLASECGCSARTIQRRLAHLTELGFISVSERRDLSGRQQSNLYRLNLDGLKPSGRPEKEGDNMTPSPGQNVTPTSEACGGDNMTPTPPSNCRGEDDTQVSPLEQSFEPNPSPSEHAPAGNSELPSYQRHAMTPDWMPAPDQLVQHLRMSSIPDCVAQRMARDVELINACRLHYMTQSRELTATGWTAQCAKWLANDWQRLGRPMATDQYNDARGFNISTPEKTAGGSYAAGQLYRTTRRERDAVDHALANPGTGSWRERWLGQSGEQAAGSESGGSSIHTSSGTIPPALGNCIQDDSDAGAGPDGACYRDQQLGGSAWGSSGSESNE